MDTQTALGETVGFFFFNTAVYSVPPVFQALAVTPEIINRIGGDHRGGLYPVSTHILSLTISTILTIVIWTPVFQAVSYSLVGIGASASSVLLMQLVLSMNVLIARLSGMVLALMIPKAALNVVIGNIIVQMCMLTNGFYTKLPSWLQWVTYLSVPRYTFVAMLKLEYSWRDLFEVDPMRGNSGVSFPSKYVTAELTGVFQAMTERKMGIMLSPGDASPLRELLVMTCLIVMMLMIIIIHGV